MSGRILTHQQALQLGLQLHQCGRLAEAEGIYRQIVAAHPSDAKATQYLGVIAHQRNQHELALDLMRRSVALDPSDAGAYSNLAAVYRALDRLDEAISACHQALRLNPYSPEAFLNLGDALQERGLLDDALTAYRYSMQLRPDYVEAINNLGDALKNQGKVDEAINAFRTANKLQPQNCAVHSNLIYALHFAENVDDVVLESEHRSWNAEFSKSSEAFASTGMHDASPERTLRVGYVSPDFRDNVVGRNLVPLFRCHDRKDYEIFCYSGTLQEDEVTTTIRESKIHWRSTAGLEDRAFAKQVHEDGIDILVDLAQHMGGNRLPVFTYLPAPVQVSFAGYPETTGLEAIGHRISDRWLERGGVRDSNSFSTKVTAHERVLLIDSFWCYDPCGIEVPVNGLPVGTNGQITFGSMNNFCKVNESVLKLYARTLTAVEGSRIIILSHEGSHRQGTIEFIQNEGVDPSRIEFLAPRPRKAYLELYHRLDIVLDTFPYNGHTTSLDALWMGVPVVTLCGERPVSRAGLSQLSNLGLSELVAFTDDQYVDIAAGLANDIPRLKELRATLRLRMEKSILMDAPSFTRQIEACYRSMWRQWCGCSANTPSPL